MSVIIAAKSSFRSRPFSTPTLDYTSDAGTADLWSPRSLRRSGLTITAVTFNLPYLLLNSRHRVLICLYARCRFLDAEGLVRGDSVGEPEWQGLARRL